MKIIKLSPLIIYVLISACAGVSTKQDTPDEVAFSVNRDLGHIEDNCLYVAIEISKRMSMKNQLWNVHEVEIDYRGKTYSHAIVCKDDVCFDNARPSSFSYRKFMAQGWRETGEPKWYSYADSYGMLSTTKSLADMSMEELEQAIIDAAYGVGDGQSN